MMLMIAGAALLTQGHVGNRMVLEIKGAEDVAQKCLVSGTAIQDDISTSIAQRGYDIEMIEPLQSSFNPGRIVLVNMTAANVSTETGNKGCAIAYNTSINAINRDGIYQGSIDGRVSVLVSGYGDLPYIAESVANSIVGVFEKGRLPQ